MLRRHAALSCGPWLAIRKAWWRVREAERGAHRAGAARRLKLPLSHGLALSENQCVAEGRAKTNIGGMRPGAFIDGKEMPRWRT